MAITLIVLAATIVAMASGKIRSDVVAIGSVLCLTVTGVLTPQEALSGFGNSVIFVMVGMFIISAAIVRTGLASIISRRILGLAGHRTYVLFILVMILTALIGSLVSNTGTVAIMMPIVVSMSLAIDESPSRFLMPLAFMSSIGGMATILGNSSNMVVNDAYVKEGYPSLTLFSFLPVGLACLLFGLLVLSPVCFWYLSRRKNVKAKPKSNRFSMRKLAERYKLAQSLYVLDTVPGSAAAGQRLEQLCLPEKYGVVVADIARSSETPGLMNRSRKALNILFPGPGTVLHPGDRLRVIGSADGVRTMAEETGLVLGPENSQLGMDEREFASAGICELIVMSSSRLVNRSVAESDLRRQFGITVLGIHRGDQYILENIKDQAIAAGDSLLVQGSWENLKRLEKHSMDWVMVGHLIERAGEGKLTEKIPLVIVTVALMLLLASLNVIPIVVSVMLAAMTLVVGGCFKNMDEAYSSISMGATVMLACLMPMSIAMQKTGIVDFVASKMLVLGADYGPHVALAVVYGVSSAMNIVISTTPVTLLVTPIALEIAQSLGYNPLPFLIAVATAASMCFASPFSTPSNALVMSAGRYTFFDYLKVGLPLQILMGIAMVAVIPSLYPFVPAK